MNLAVFASGNGSNFEAIIKEIKKGKLKVNLIILVCDQPEAFVIKRAIRLKVRTVIIDRRDFKSKADFESAILERLKNYKVDFIALAGFMRLLSPRFVKRYNNRIMNIHPSLLPAFKGSCAIKDAYNSKCLSTGVTVHFVDEEVDHGPVILQKELRLDRKQGLEDIEKKIHAIEHRLYPEALRLYIEGRIKIRKGKVICK